MWPGATAAGLVNGMADVLCETSTRTETFHVFHNKPKGKEILKKRDVTQNYIWRLSENGDARRSSHQTAHTSDAVRAGHRRGHTRK